MKTREFAAWFVAALVAIVAGIMLDISTLLLIGGIVYGYALARWEL